jgi:hypothetical protein
MAWVKLFVQMLLFAAVVLVVYNVLKRYVLTKIKINKWIIFAVAVIVLILPNILAGPLGLNIQNNLFWVYGPSSIFIILFLWFVDLSGWNNRRTSSSSAAPAIGFGKKDKKKDVVIRPKAKPNRAKNNKKD